MHCLVQELVALKTSEKVKGSLLLYSSTYYYTYHLSGFGLLAGRCKGNV